MLNRREMLFAAAGAALAADLPRTDYHVHAVDAITVDRALEISARRGVKFGLLKHAGVAGHGYQVTSDAELNAWIASLQGKPVFIGIEGEGMNWPSAFSKATLARIDYAQSDPLAITDRAGAMLMSPDFRSGGTEAFMDRYVVHHVELISTLPIDILAVPTFLPASLDYDHLWTPRRIRSVIDAALKHNVAIEIDTRFRVPRSAFLEMAKSAGLKFAFGSNDQTLDGIGDISYGLESARRLNLTAADLFSVRRPRR